MTAVFDGMAVVAAVLLSVTAVLIILVHVLAVDGGDETR